MHISIKHFLYLLLYISTLLITQVQAYTCQNIKVTITNNSQYDWYIDDANTDYTDNMPNPMEAHRSYTFSQNSSNWYDVVSFAGSYSQTVAYYAKTVGGTNQLNYTFQFHLHYDPCPAQYTNKTITAKAEIQSDPLNILTTTSDSGFSGWLKTCYKHGIPYPCNKDPKDGKASVTISTVTGVGLNIDLSDVITQDPTLSNQTFLQQTFDNLNPKILNLLDYSLSNPVNGPNNMFSFNMSCTSDACKHIS